MTPSEFVVGAANEVLSGVDSLGRRLTVRRQTALDTLRLFKAAGPALAQNEAWLALASLACAVVAIDDIPIPYPTSEAQIESIVEKLGDAGLEVVDRLLEPAGGPADADLLGNLRGTPF